LVGAVVGAADSTHVPHLTWQMARMVGSLQQRWRVGPRRGG
jgi:hypothetical protein